MLALKCPIVETVTLNNPPLKALAQYLLLLKLYKKLNIKKKSVLVWINKPIQKVLMRMDRRC